MTSSPNPPAAGDIAEEKAAARRSAFSARKAAHETLRASAPIDAALHFMAAEFLGEEPAIIAGYRPIRTEIDPTHLMQALSAAGHRLCVPVIEGEGKPLAFREWTPGCVMTDGAFGAQVPAAGDWLEPALLIVPLVAFDGACRRLGYGGGFYDRTIEQLSARGPCRTVGLAYAAQRVDALPHEATDRPLDAIVTEDGVQRCGGAS